MPKSAGAPISYTTPWDTTELYGSDIKLSAQALNPNSPATFQYQWSAFYDWAYWVMDYSQDPPQLILAASESEIVNPVDISDTVTSHTVYSVEFPNLASYDDRDEFGAGFVSSYYVFSQRVVNTGPGTLSFSIYNNATVPEPAAWTLLVAGFGLVGATMRRSKSNRRTKLSPVCN